MHLGAFTYNALRTVQGDKVNMAAGGQNWGKFKEKMKELRQGKKGKKDSGKSAKDLETIVVQRLSAEVSGKAQKYSRVGAREFVPFEQFDEISVCNIKKACMKHYGMPETMSCDVLAGEQGPSCSSVKQLPTLKVIHVRFIEGKVEDAPIEVSAGVSERRKRKISEISQGQKAAAVTSVSQRASQSPSKFVPRSLSVVDMLKLGKLITNTTTSVEIFNFDMSGMAWTGRPSTVEFSIEPEPFGTGGFRKAFKATSNDRGFNGSTWVVKKYLKKAADDILTIGQTIEEQTKKVVQMHYLARNFAAKLKEELLASDNEILFGETMSYKKIFMGKIGEESSLEDGGTSTAVKFSCQIKEKLFPVINLQAHLSNLHLNLTGSTPSHKSSQIFTYIFPSLEDGGTSTAVKFSCQIKEKLFPVINLQAHLSNLHLNLTGSTPSHKSSQIFTYIFPSLEDGGTSTAVKFSCQIKEKLFPVINLQAHLSNLHLNLTGSTPSHKFSHTFFQV